MNHTFLGHKQLLFCFRNEGNLGHANNSGSEYLAMSYDTVHISPNAPFSRTGRFANIECLHGTRSSSLPIILWISLCTVVIGTGHNTRRKMLLDDVKCGHGHACSHMFMIFDGLLCTYASTGKC